MSAAPQPDFDRASCAYRRCIALDAPGDGVVVAALEDDFHHFVVTLRHDGTHVTSVECDSRRWPWTTCPDAAGPLRALAGMPLARRFTAAGGWTDPRRNCSHQFDAAALAVTHAAWGRRRRRYDVEVPPRDGDGRTRVRLWVDRALRIEWTVTWTGLVDPPPGLAGAPWRGGFMRWADEHLDEEAAECAIVARRAADISIGRGWDLDAIPSADRLPPVMAAVCYTMQPDVIGSARRHVGSIRDFAATPEALGGGGAGGEG